MSKKKSNSFNLVLNKLITDVFEKSGNKPLNYKQVASKLNLHDDESRELILEILKEETKKGILNEPEKGKFLLKQLKTFVTGKVDMTSDGSAYIISEDEFEEDIYVAPRKLRNALHGDIVKVYVYAKNKGRKKDGEVVEILQRAKMDFTGIVNLSDRFAFFIPDDRKMLHDIFIPIDSLKGAKDKDKAIARIVDWPEDAKNPIGQITHVLGKQGENNAEMNAILADYGFPLAFPDEVERQAESIEEIIPAEEIAKRRDFRNVLTFTIDPIDAKDFDDAISFRKLDNGNVEIGVHIADVSHYVKQGTALDKEAFERGTSVYLVDRVIPMLPERLSNGLCSLRPNEDKLCFSAVFELDNEANVVEQWFGRTIIHSDTRFSYEDAQEILENKSGKHSEELLKLNELAYILRERKFKHGAISFESVEIKFRLDEQGKPLGVYAKERKDAHKLIEDFMLLANKKVAEFIAKKGKGKQKLTFVYRSHDSPKEDALLNFSQFALKFGYKIDTSSGRETAKSLNFLMADVEGKKEQNVLTQLAIRSMAKAVYTTKKHSHYGLAFDYYTHFTSPIRRYSVKYKQAEFLLSNIGMEYNGIISGLTEWGMYVEIIENKCEGMIRLRDLNDDFYVLDEKNYCIIGQRRKKKYQLGDEVRILVKKVDLAKRQIDFSLVRD
jgi:ribonuclease R